MKVIVESAIDVRASPEKVWGLLYNAKLPLSAPCCFKIGVPTPDRCTLVSERGAVGAQRRCQTKEGEINQRITEWDPPRRLSFVMESNTLGLEKHISAMSDTFTIQPADAGCRLTRRTTIETKGFLAFPKSLLFRVSMGHIHRFVMRNFKALGEAP